MFPWLAWLGIAFFALAVIRRRGAASSSSSPALPSGPMPTIRLGSQGAAVEKLQRALNLPGTGNFDASTDAAVRAFQAQKGLAADGIVGPKTWGALGFQGTSAPASSSSTPSPTAASSSSSPAADTDTPHPGTSKFSSDAGAELASSIAEREAQILAAVAAGRARFTWRTLTIERGGRRCIVSVMTRALAVDLDSGRLIVSCTFPTAQRIADLLGACMLTSRVSDLVWRSADVRLTPITRPWSEDGTMSTTARMREQSAAIDAAVAGRDGFVANEGKDWVITARNWRDMGFAGFNLPHGQKGSRHNGANFGWYGIGNSKSPGGERVQQSIGLAHGMGHVDYSQLLRFMQLECWLDGDRRTVASVLADPALAPLLSDEGPLPDVVHPDLAAAA